MGDTHRVEIPPVITGPEAPVKGEHPTAPNAGERPSYVPEKFWKDGKVDLEGFSKSYSELEKRHSAPKPEGEQKPKDEPKGEQPKPEGEQKPKDQTQGEQVVIPGVTPEQTTKYWEELSKGNLSETSYGELAKAGYPKAVVDAYIRGIQAEQADGTAMATEIKKIAGGEDQYAVMTDWMANNMTPAEVADYNKAMNSGNKFVIEAAVKEAHARYTKAVGTDPKLLGGHGNTPAAGDVFRSQAEITAAMKDPRYRKDAAYRQSVSDKIRRSSL